MSNRIDHILEHVTFLLVNIIFKLYFVGYKCNLTAIQDTMQGILPKFICFGVQILELLGYVLCVYVSAMQKGTYCIVEMSYYLFQYNVFYTETN